MIDDLLPDEWPPSVLEAVAKFRQGDVIESPPVIFVAAAAHGVTTLVQETGDPSLDDELFELEERPPFGMITTETCDISEGEASSPKQPFVLMAPVFNVGERVTPAVRANIETDRLGYVRRLTGAAFADGLWVADLRIELPLEKSMLVGREPISGFDTARERLALADFLAARRDRPVLSDGLHVALIRPLRRWLEQHAARREEMLADVVEVRVAIAGGREDPEGAGLLIVTDHDDLPEAAKELWEARWENLRGRMESAGMALAPTAYETLDSLSARNYIESVRVDLNLS